MNHLRTKIILTFLTALIVGAGFQALITIANLNEFAMYMYAAFALYVLLVFKVVVAYDVHFRYSHDDPAKKNIFLEEKRYFKALLHRTRHLWTGQEIALCVNYIFLPTLTYWSTVILIQLNLGHAKLQQVPAFASTAVIAVNYWYVKEIFSQWREKVAPEIFVRMTVVKIFAAAITFLSTLALMRRYCLDYSFFTIIVFCVSFLLVYQSLYHHKRVTDMNVGIAALIALAQGVLAYFVYRFWGLNYYTGGLLLAVTYNLWWGLFHYHLDHALTKRVLLETLIICLIIAGIIFNATNFRAQLLDACLF